MAEITAQSRYKALMLRRQPFLDRAREAAELTIPSLMPPEGYNGTQKLREPYSGFGARLVVNLSSRIMAALYPTGQKFFRLTVPAWVLLQSGQEKPDHNTERGLTLTEDMIQSEVERRQWRQPTNTAIQHLIVCGNALEQMLPDNTIRVFRLDQYVVVRDPSGALIEFVVEEFLSPHALPDNLQKMVGKELGTAAPLPLYTWGRLLPNGKWRIHQEFMNLIVPGSEGDYKVNPFNALRWCSVVGDDYGRGKAEEHLPDLRAVNGLSKSLLDGAAMASRNITMIRPNAAGGLNLRRRLVKAANGEFVVGNPEDVAMLNFQNVNGLQVAQAELELIKRELGAAFLLNSAIARDAERVTAYELRQLAEEIEGTLGGVFSMLAQEMQLARLHRLMVQMKAQKALPDFKDGIVEPTILTGLEALGREQEFQRAATAFQFLSTIPPEQWDYVKMEKLLGKAFFGLGFPESVRTDEEVQAIREQRAMQEAMANAALTQQQQAQGEGAQ